MGAGSGSAAASGSALGAAGGLSTGGAAMKGESEAAIAGLISTILLAITGGTSGICVEIEAAACAASAARDTAASNSPAVLAIFFAAASYLAATSPSSFLAVARRASSSAIFSWICLERRSDLLKFSWAASAIPCRPVAAIETCSAAAATVTERAWSERWRLSRASSWRFA